MAPVKSHLWKFFQKNDKSATCRICCKVIKTCGNTTNLKSHMNRMHGDIMRGEAINRCRTNQATYEVPQNERVILGDESKPSSASCSSSLAINRCRTNQATDEVPQNEGSILGDGSGPSSASRSSPLEVENPIVCMTQNQSTQGGRPENSTAHSFTDARPHQQQIKDAFKKIKSYSDGGNRNGRITNAIIYMICKDLLPLSHVEDDGFKYLMKVAVPLYSVPSRRKVTSMIDEKYELMANMYRTTLASSDNLTLTTDIWSETLNTKSFLGITVHYLQNKNLVSATIGVTELKESHTSEYLSRVLLSVCEQWNITLENVMAVVTDNAANIVKSIHDTFSKKKHLPCFAHTLNLVPSKAIELTVGLPERISHIKAIVTWFKQCIAGADMLRKLQLESGKSEGQILRLKQDIPTRWNSTFYMLDQFVKLSEHVNNVLLKFPQAPSMLTATQLQEVMEIIELLRPIESIITEISGSKYVTSSKVIPLVHCLEAHIEAANPSLDISRDLKRKLQDEIQKRFGQIEGVSIVATATLLDPRFKKLHFKDPISCSKTIKNVSAMMREIQCEESISISETNDAGSGLPSGKFDLWSHHKQLVATRMNASLMENTGVPNELSQYLGSPVLSLDSDPIQEWHKCQSLYPVLFQVAMKYLPIVATSVPSESLFSKAGNIMTQKRNRLTGKRLSKLIFLNTLSDSQWGLSATDSTSPM